MNVWAKIICVTVTQIILNNMISVRCIGSLSMRLIQSSNC